jgi:hypothetical protein
MIGMRRACLHPDHPENPAKSRFGQKKAFFDMLVYTHDVIATAVHPASWWENPWRGRRWWDIPQAAISVSA